MEKVPHKTDIQALTGIRWLAACWVVVFHFRPTIIALFPGAQTLDPFWQSGYLGVDLFFSLSGFILCYNYWDQFSGGFSLRSYAAFLKLRLARLYPVHFITLHIAVVSIAFAKLMHWRVPSPDQLDHSFIAYVANLLLVHAWVLRHLSWNFPAWSISSEWFAYLFFPFAVALLAAANVRSRLYNAIFAAVAYGITIAYFLVLFRFGLYFRFDNLVRISGEFLAGCFLCRVCQQSQRSRTWSAVSVAAVVGVIAAPWFINATDLRGIWLAPVLGLLILALSLDSGPAARALSHPWIEYGGKISYCLYMIHGLVETVLGVVFRNGKIGHFALPFRIGILLLQALIVLAAAILLFHIVEEPGRRWIRRIGDSKSAERERELFSPADHLRGSQA